MKSLCFTAMLAILASGATAQDAAPAPAEGFPPRANLRAEAFKQFDKDGDGKLNEEERKAMMDARKAQGEKFRAEREKAFDKDGDGKLNDEEKAAMLAANKERMEQFRKEREKAFDKDGDGKLSDEERKAMRAEFEKRRPNDGQRFQELIK
jgi:Ca2+-binding EF-hand superfamily protein